MGLFWCGRRLWGSSRDGDDLLFLQPLLFFLAPLFLYLYTHSGMWPCADPPELTCEAIASFHHKACLSLWCLRRLGSSSKCLPQLLRPHVMTAEKSKRSSLRLTTWPSSRTSGGGGAGENDDEGRPFALCSTLRALRGPCISSGIKGGHRHGRRRVKDGEDDDDDDDKTAAATTADRSTSVGEEGGGCNDTKEVVLVGEKSSTVFTP
mmetsp:Transcript_73659/g.148404  ORF Transcript_73659/g.148404 Transcript_73659/m.148404 type:complete len:207 (-) Transcript_73659:429-1049(-)